MTNEEKAKKLDEIAKLAAGAASALRHGRYATAEDKIDHILDAYLAVRLEREIL